ncbi:ABC transporter ATP-binding protein [Azospirillum largimobile]
MLTAGALATGGWAVWLRPVAVAVAAVGPEVAGTVTELFAEENVAVALDLAGVSGGEARRRARALLDYLEVGHRRASLPSRLSGGEAQRVAIARALVNRPRIILADEPTAALDSGRAGMVMDLLRRLAVEQQAAVLVVTHDETIFGRFDHAVSLRDGMVEAGHDG